jgi:putative acetyltransferase
MIYVDPEFAEQGVGTTLLDAIEKIAQRRGAAKLTAEVSDTAKPLFDRRQFQSERRSVKQIDDEWLGNTTMSKALGPKPTEH